MSAVPASEIDSCGLGCKGICFDVCFFVFMASGIVTAVLLTLHNVSQAG